MDLLSLYYFMETANDLHISTTAERLYMSQQTLSNHIQRVEDYYGTTLLQRRPKLHLTPAGEEVFKFAEKFYSEEKNLRNVLCDVDAEKGNETGEIIIGACSPRANTYLPQLMIAFFSLYPNVHIKWVDKTSRTLEQLVQKNELDFAVCLDSDPQKTVFSNRIIHSDPVYLCVSEKLLQQHYGEETKALKKKAINGAAVNDFIRLPFLMPESENRLGKVISECFTQENLTPLVRVQTTYTSILMPLCNAGLAAGFTSKMNLKEWISLFAEDVNIFPLYCNGSPVTQTVHVIYNKQRYLNRYTRYFLDLLEEYFQEIAQQDLTRLAPTLSSV